MTSIFQLLFSLTSVIFEADPEWVAKVEENSGGLLPINKYHDKVIENAKFITYNGGRGLFYLFQGALWFDLASSFTDVLTILTGAFLLLVGVLHILMHYKI